MSTSISVNMFPLWLFLIYIHTYLMVCIAFLGNENFLSPLRVIEWDLMSFAMKLLVKLFSKVKQLGIHHNERLTWKVSIEVKILQTQLNAVQLDFSILKLECKLLLHNVICQPMRLYGISKRTTTATLCYALELTRT